MQADLYSQMTENARPTHIKARLKLANDSWANSPCLTSGFRPKPLQQGDNHQRYWRPYRATTRATDGRHSLPRKLICRSRVHAASLDEAVKQVRDYWPTDRDRATPTVDELITTGLLTVQNNQLGAQAAATELRHKPIRSSHMECEGGIRGRLLGSVGRQ